MLLVNNRPLFPYVKKLDYILNPWGYGSFPMAIRLDESTTVEMVVRGVKPKKKDAEEPEKGPTVGGRIMGRFWYNPAYGNARNGG